MNRDIYEIKELYSLTNLEAEILNLLLQNPKGMTAQEINRSFPHRGENVYRPLDKLVDLGIAKKSNQHPALYSPSNLKKKFRNVKGNRILTLNSTLPLFSRIRIKIKKRKAKIAKSIRSVINAD